MGRCMSNPRPGDVVTLEVSSLSLEGAGLATLDGREISAFGAFPGETVEARIEHVSKHHARAGAKTLKVLVAHPSRGSSPCPDDVTNGGRCTGCALGVLDVAAQRELKRSMLAEKFGIQVDAVVGGEGWGYRASSKRIAFSHGPRVGLGSYVRGSHYAASMQHCRVEHPRIAEAAREVERVATELAIPPYDENTHSGLLRSVWLKTDGERVLVTLVVVEHDARVDALGKALKLAAGVAVAIVRKSSNDLRGEQLVHVVGARALTVTLAGESVKVGPLGFLQPNPSIAERAYRDLVCDESGVERSGSLAFDLYAGSGVTRALLQKRFTQVEACESYPESAKALGIEPSTALAFLAAWRAKHGTKAPELVVANPPRAGLGADVCAELVALGTPSLAMMSCHPGTLAEDLARLTAGGYRLVKSVAYDTLPQTPHVELVVWLERG